MPYKHTYKYIVKYLTNINNKIEATARSRSIIPIHQHKGFKRELSDRP